MGEAVQNLSARLPARWMASSNSVEEVLFSRFTSALDDVDVDDEKNDKMRKSDRVIE